MFPEYIFTLYKLLSSLEINAPLVVGEYLVPYQEWVAQKNHSNREALDMAIFGHPPVFDAR